MNNTALLKNIPKLYIIKIAKWFMLSMPIIVLFFQENKLSMQDIFTLKAIYSISVIVLEIPSGYFADLMGRKFTLIIGSILGCAGFIIYSISGDFNGFLIAEIILGIGQSFISGSDSALMYDTLKATGKQDQFMKQEGRLISTGNFAEAAAGLLGGLLASISLRTPFICQIFIAATAIPASFMLIEPITNIKKQKASLKHIVDIVQDSLIINKELRWNIVFSSIIGCSSLTLAWFIQPYFKQFDLQVTLIGALWTALNTTVGIVALFAYKIENLLGKTKTSIIILIGISINIFLIGIIESSWAIIFLFIFYGIRGIATPILKEYINRITNSEVRATVLSLRNFIIRICFTIIGPFLGWYNDMFSMNSALIIMGIIFFILGGFSLILVYKTENSASNK